MTEELITYPTAILARKKGFDEPCRQGWEYYEFNGKIYGPKEISAEGNNYAPPNEMYYEYARNLDEPTRNALGLAEKVFKLPSFKNLLLPPWLYARPTQDLLERWLREVHGIDIMMVRYPGWSAILDGMIH